MSTPIVSPRLTHARRSQSPGSGGEMATSWSLFVVGAASRIITRMTTRPLCTLLAAVAAVAVMVVVVAQGGGGGGWPVITPAVRPASALEAVPSFPTPLLTSLELLTLQTYARGADLYVEWGSGASTSLVAPLAKRAVSIDNNKEWCSKVATRDDVKWWVAQGALRLVCIDTGPTVAFGAPAAGADVAQFPAYSRVVDDVVVKHERNGGGARRAMKPPSSPSPSFSVFFVDGRFRVACALHALKHVHGKKGVVIVHDWEREVYGKTLLPFFQVVEVAGRLAVLTDKEGTDWGAWRAAVEGAEGDPA